jgi:TatD DNase family protein
MIDRFQEEKTVRLFDSHCHVHDEIYEEDFDDMVQRAAHAGVLGAMVVGFNVKSSQKAASLAETRPFFFASVGVHPHDAKSCDEAGLNILKALARNSKIRAWGEIGLDFNRMYSPQAVQEKWFIRQLEIVDELHFPVILHERDSQGRLLDILKQTHNADRTGVVHCFSGNTEELFTYLDMGYFIGITGILTIEARGQLLRQQAVQIPAHRLLVETDAPYLTPSPHRNKTQRNEPAFVRSVLLKLAEIRGDDPERLSEIVWENTCRLFHVDPVLDLKHRADVLRSP